MSFVYILLATVAVRAALIPQQQISTEPDNGGASQSGLPSISSGLIQALPTYSGLMLFGVQSSLSTSPSSVSLSSPTTSSIPATSNSVITKQTLSISDGLNPLSLASIPMPASSNAVVDVFNGINVAFPTPTISAVVLLASVISNADQMLSSATRLLEAAVTSILPTSSVLPLQTTITVLSSVSGIQPSSTTGLSLGFSSSKNSLVVSSIATSDAVPSLICAILSPGASDAPTFQDNDTGLFFRSSCGISAATVLECPYLCSQGGGAFFQECAISDISGEQPMPQFPPIVCTRCLSPCVNGSSITLGTSRSDLSKPPSAASATMVSLASRSVLSRPALAATRMSLASRSELSNSSPAATGMSLASHSELSKPSPVATSASSSAFDTSLSSMSVVSSMANVALNGSSTRSPRFRLSAPLSLVVISTTARTPIFSPVAAGPTAVKLSNGTGVFIIPVGTAVPAILEPSTCLVQASCGLTTGTVAKRPFNSSAGGAGPYRNCSTGSMIPRFANGSCPLIPCSQCPQPCPAATTNFTGQMCSSVASGLPGPSSARILSGLLYSATTGADLSNAVVSKRRFH